MINPFENIFSWIKEDWRSHPLRFSIELFAWALSIGCTMWMGYTLPNPPFIYLYPLFMIQCMLFAWSAWTRGSTGMIANYLLIVTIDAVAYARML
jgi:hypothetical protein